MIQKLYVILIGWSWDICAKDINNIRINIVFQTITYLLGNEFIKEWLNNKSNLADYLMLAYDKLIENYGEKRAEKIMKIFCKISIEETSKKDKLELEKWKKIIKEKKVELDKKWETSGTRKICICILTYIVVVIYSYIVKNYDNIFLSSLKTLQIKLFFIPNYLAVNINQLKLLTQYK
mgnify:CR=1 FL=1